MINHYHILYIRDKIIISKPMQLIHAVLSVAEEYNVGHAQKLKINNALNLIKQSVKNACKH